MENSAAAKRLKSLGEFPPAFRAWVRYIGETWALLKLGYPFGGDELSRLTWLGLAEYDAAVNEMQSRKQSHGHPGGNSGIQG